MLRFALVALAALAVLAPAAAAERPVARAPDPAWFPREGTEVERLSAARVARGRLAGRVVLRVRVRYAAMVPRRVARLPDRARATHHGRLRIALFAGGRRLGVARDRNALVLMSGPRAFRLTHHVVLSRAQSRFAARAGRLRARVEAVQEVRVDGRGRPDGHLADRETATRRVVLAPRAPRPAAPQCERFTFRAGYARRSRTSLVCMGEGVRFRLAGGPLHGRARVVRSALGRAIVEYAAPPRRTGRDRIVLRVAAHGAPAAAGVAGASVVLPIEVQPFKLRAIGDSVTAGFGFLGNGVAWGPEDLPECVPPTPPNNRCSSNSPNGVGSAGPVGWSPDFGLGNGVAWPAQFARQVGLTGPGTFANYAVTGSTPADWDSGGYLTETLQDIVADGPDLTVLTLGANPLLDSFLFGRGIECAVSMGDAALRACVQSFVDAAKVVPRLQSVVRQLLAAPGNRVVVSQYHQAIPATALFSADQLRIMFAVLNLNVRQAVRRVEGFGTRAFLMAPPPFNVGLPPGDSLCPSGGGTPVDGPSRQARVSQDEMTVDHPFTFCGTREYWIVSADTGIHPSRDGHAQYAYALSQLALANGLVPPLPSAWSLLDRA